MSNEVQVIEATQSELAVARPPEVVLQEARRAADALKDVISKKERPVIFNREQYLEFEDWQTIGNFYGLKAKTGEAEPVTIDGIAGAKARAEVIDVRSGRVVGGAEAYCLRDEPNWQNKPWFQLASMAQTRAGSKSLRNILAWVVVLAGYKPTPADEMDGVFKPNIPQTRPKQDATMVQPATDKYTGAQLDKLANTIKDIWTPRQEEDGAGHAALVADTAGQTQQASDAPPAHSKIMMNSAEYCRQQAEQAPVSAKELPLPRFTFGKHKGKPVDDPSIPDDYLSWIEPKIVEWVNDYKRVAHKPENQALLDAVRGVLIDRNAMPLA